MVRDGEKLFFHSAMAGLKVNSLRENPQVCLLFVENPTIYEKGLTTLYTSTVVRGKVTEVTDSMKTPCTASALRPFCAGFDERGNRMRGDGAEIDGCVVH